MYCMYCIHCYGKYTYICLRKICKVKVKQLQEATNKLAIQQRDVHKCIIFVIRLLFPAFPYLYDKYYLR